MVIFSLLRIGYENKTFLLYVIESLRLIVFNYIQTNQLYFIVPGILEYLGKRVIFMTIDNVVYI